MDLTSGEIVIPQKKGKVLKMTPGSNCNVEYPERDCLEVGTMGPMTSSLRCSHKNNTTASLKQGIKREWQETLRLRSVENYSYIPSD